MTRSLPVLPDGLLRLVRDTRGATAVEFALVLPLFLAMVFSIFEAGWLMTQTIMQDGALERFMF
jgi:Flp pilus assembly protein TadG